MSTDEKKIPDPQPTPQSGAKNDEDIDAFLDSASVTDADDFLEKLYQDSFADLTSDFDTLLQEFRSIDPDELPPAQAGAEPAGQIDGDTAQTAPDAPNETQEMEDIFSYSDHSVGEDMPAASAHHRFSEAVEQAMDAELGEQPAEQDMGDTFRVSLDRLDGEDGGLGDAVEEASQTAVPEGGTTRVFSPVAQPQDDAPQSSHPVQQPRPAQTQSSRPAPKKKKKSFLLPQKNDSTFEIFRKVLFMVSVVVVLVCLVIIGNIYLLQPTLQKRREARIDALMGESVSDAAAFEQSYGNTELPSGARYNLAQFYAENPDFYGYLDIPNTSVSTPVVQGKDNSKYLRHNFFGESTKYGCPFVNYKNTYSALDYNTSIFGHNMEYDDLVFGALEQYRKIDGFKKAPLIRLETMYAEYTFKIYAVFLTDADYDSTGWYFDYIFTQLKDEAECKEYIAQLDQRKLYSTGVDIKPTDKLLTLSTCSYDFNGERLVVVARLVRSDESTEVNVTKAVANNNPRYPDRYYKKKGMTNPYLNAEKWIPNA